METESFVSGSLQIHHPEREEHPQAEPEADQPGDLQEEQQEVHPEPEEHEGKIPEQGQCHQYVSAGPLPWTWAEVPQARPLPCSAGCRSRTARGGHTLTVHPAPMAKACAGRCFFLIRFLTSGCRSDGEGAEHGPGGSPHLGPVLCPGHLTSWVLLFPLPYHTR